MAENLLMHYGVRGMRWGIRKRSGGSSSSSHKTSEEKTDHQRAREALKARSTKHLSDQELRKVLNRFDMERKYKDLTPSRYKKAMKFADDFAKGANTFYKVSGRDKKADAEWAYNRALKFIKTPPRTTL